MPGRIWLSRDLFIWAGFGLAIGYWFFDSIVMLLIEDNQNFLELLLTTDGHELWMRSVTAAVCIAAGFALNRVDRHRETARNNAETLARDLDQANRYLSNAARISGLGFWTWDRDAGRFTYCSDRLAVLFGFPDGESMRNELATPALFLSRIHVDDRQRLDRLLDQLARDHRGVDTEFRVVTGDGEVRHLHALVELVSGGPAEGEEIGIVRDISAQKAQQETLLESQRLLRTVVDSIPATIDLRDSGERYLLINDYYARIVGQDGLPLPDVAAAVSSAITQDPKRETYLQFARHALHTGKTVPYTDVESFGPHERTIWRTTKIPVESPVTGERLVLTVAFDVTERRLAAEQLRRAQRMEAVGQLTAGLAHDFNNLLAVIRGNADMLADTLGPDDQLLSALIRATDRGAALTQRLLAFARRQVLQPIALDANRLISDLLPLLRRTLEPKIEIALEGGEGLWQCEADPAQLENALLNLALNARDAMPAGGRLMLQTRNVRLDESFAREEQDLEAGAYVQITVTDSGIGMAEEVRARVFEPFFTTKSRGEGSGLGLSMVYGFAKQSGGHVTLASEPDRGTVVTLYLPLSKAPAQSVAEAEDAGIPVGRGEQVLMVEDDPDVRAMTAAMLVRLGYRPLETADAAGALRLAEEAGRPDVLLTDIVLRGDLDGRALAERLRGRWPDLPVLFISGYSGRAQSGLEPGEDESAYLQKPFARGDLAIALHRILDTGPGA